MQRTILIADDDPAIRNLVSECLTNPYTTCAQAADGAAAVLQASRSRPDAIVLDLEMPVLNGFDACLSLKSDPSTKSIPIVFLTANGEVPDKVRGLDLGAVDYITKPFEADELRARIRSVMRAQRELRRADARVARDELTGLFNQAYLTQRMESDLAASCRHNRPLACCVVGIGDLPAAMARHGSAACDDAVRRMAGGVLAVLRREDVACRYDGAAIAVLAFTATEAGAMTLGQHIHAAATSALAAAGVDAAAYVGVALSHYTIGQTLLWRATEALRHAELTAPGTVQFGGELTEFHLANGPVN